MSKVTSVYNRSVQTTQALANGEWPAFLRTAAWNYRYSFPNQVLIYAQRPEATACASMEDWNKKLHRRVKPRARGIALLEDSGDQMTLSYIFDVADTHSPTNAPVPIWTMTEAKEEDVRIALASTCLPGTHPYMDDVMAHTPTNFYYEVAHYLCDQLAGESVQDLLSAKDSCEALQNLSDEELTWEFKTLLQTSIASMMMYRCGLEPDVDPAAWESAKRFQDLPSMAVLGQTTQRLARQGLEIARYAVRKWDKEHKEEKQYEQRPAISAERPVSDPEPDHSGSGAAEYIRESAKDLSEGTQAQPVHAADVVRGSDEPSSYHRGTDAAAGNGADGGSVAEEPGASEDRGQSGLDESHESPAEAGRGDGLSGDDLRIDNEEEELLPEASSEGLDVIFPTPEEQDAMIEASASERKLTQDEIDSILHQIIDSQGADMNVISVFLDDPNSEEAISALREAYEPLDDVFRLSFSDQIAAVAGRPYGIEVRHDGRHIIPWNEFAAFFQKQVDEHRFGIEEEENPRQVTSCDELAEGQVFQLAGKQYRVSVITDAFVGLQDVDYPIFSTSMPRNTLDILLRNNVPEARSEPVVAEIEPAAPASNDQPSAPEMSEHIPEPLIDHPELIAHDISSEARRDKVVLTDLLMHFINYWSSYADAMPALSAHDAKDYLEQRESLENMAASDSPVENRQRIEVAIGFFNRWFLPFSEGTHESIQNDMNQVLTAAEEALANWAQLNLINNEEATPAVPVEEAAPEAPSYSAESFHVGDFYEDANGRGVITSIAPEGYDGRHQAMFSFSDPDAPEGSRAFQGFVMLTETAVERLANGEATLTPAAQWQAQREEQPDVVNSSPEEPSLFDFTYEEPPQPSEQDAPEQADSEPVSVNAVPSAKPSERINFQIPLEAENYGGPKARFQNNIAAIRLLKTLESEGRLASAEEQKTLSKYVGWGGISQAFDPNNRSWNREYQELKELLTDKEYESARESTLTAFYTPPEVTEAIYNGLRQLGFNRGNILDPCCGTGHFFGMLPDDMKESRLYGVELDDISGRIGRQLYQNANIVIEGYEKTKLPDSMFDVAVGNVPFGNYQLPDRRYDKEHFLIHDYFFAKTLDKVRPGGVIAFVTSKGTMDKENESVRRYIAQRADLLGAIRLPDNTFKDNAGTEAVADILFLKKRERPSIEVASWIGLDREFLGFDDNRRDIWGPTINSYFVENPEMVLGKLVEVSGPHGPVLTCKAKRGKSLRSELQRAISNIEGSIGNLSVDLNALDEPTEKANCLPADPSVRNFSYTVVDGDVYFREDSVMYRREMNKTAEKRVKGMVGIRNITRDLIQAQLEDAPDAHIEALQNQLNNAYDEFTKKHGIINSNANSRAFSDDSSYYLLCSLENLDDEGNFVSKADIFTKRTIGHHKAPDHVETAQDALAVSLSELGRIDLGYMSHLSDLSEEKLASDLKGLIFPVPGREGEYQISSLYLSGNVREKLQEAKEAASVDPRYEENVAALEEAMPEPLPYSDISLRLGSTWIPTEYYKQFVMELLKLPEYCNRYMDVVYEPITGYWSVTGKNIAPAYSTLNNSTYGTSRIDALTIIDRTLNLRDVQVFDTKTGPDGMPQRVLNGEETLAAQEKQQQIKDAFNEWIWADHDRREHICQIYNETFNSIVPPKFSADLVQFHGLNPLIELAPHQKESVARILYSGNTLLAHAVGAGKTWTMAASAMEGKYLGLCNKSLIVVPNHLIGQWTAAIYEAYPQANVLASTEKDFEPANRKKFCSRIATGDYDIVVIGHSHFEKIPLSPERQEAYIRKEMDDILDSISALKASQGEPFSIKKLEAAKKGLQTKLDKLHNSKKRDDVITFEELGVDRLYVDESHNYKNLFINTKMHNVAGIGQTDSQKASDMFLKSRYMDEVTGGMGIIHATGTPLSNTMAELYTTQRYLQYDLLQKMGLGSFDAWASTYGETITALELAPEGNGYRPRTRFAKFFNVPELMNLYKQVADIRTPDMLNLPVPAVEYQVEVLKPSEEQKAIVRSFGERADKIRKGGVNNREDNMLCITNEGRKAALDQRLIDPTLPDNPNSKTAACANSIYDFYCKGQDEKLTQLVFCDISTPKKGEFNVYDDLKEKLVAKGIPAEEIRYIHEVNTVPQKDALFAKVRSGAVRVLMGSTGKMGTGTCVQDRLIAGHDLDAPWRPSDLEQRAGRVIRRGNHNDKVFIRRYVTEGTFDSYMYQLLEIKQKFNDQIFTSDNPARIVKDIDGAALDYAEIKALSSGDDRIREKVTLEMEISKLEVLKSRHKNDMYQMDHLMKILPLEIQGLKERISAMQEDKALAASRPSRTAEGKLIPATVKGVTFEKQEETGLSLIANAKKLPSTEEWHTLGSLRGFQIQGMIERKTDANIYISMAIAGKCRYSIDVPRNSSGQGLMMRLNNIIDSTIDARLDKAQKDLASRESDLTNVKNQSGKPFADEALLQEKKKRLAQLDEELNLEAKEKEDASQGRGEAEVEVIHSTENSGKRSLSEIIASAAQITDTSKLDVGHEKNLAYSRS